MNSSPAPAYYALTPDNHAPWVVATSLIFLIYSVIAVIAKLLLRINPTSIKAADICLIVCLFLLVIQTSLVIRSCNIGLGKHTDALSSAAYTSYSKYHYASTLLSIVIQAGTKLSICLLINIISPQYRLLLVNRVLMAVIGTWAISGFFAVAFQCDLPNPWQASDHACTSIRGIYIYNGVMNILTDLVICVLPVAMMWNVHTNTAKKVQVCALFGARILVPVVTIPALTTSNDYFSYIYTDPTWYGVVPTILAQISLNLSVLTACIPGLKSILDNLLSGTANARVRGSYNLTDSGDKKTRLNVTPWNASAGSKQSGSGLKPGSKTNASNSGHRSLNDNSHHRFSISGGYPDAIMSGARHDGSTDTNESSRHLNDGFILRTDDYDVSSIKQISRSHTEEEHPVSAGRIQ